jgi:hypothetical protein
MDEHGWGARLPAVLAAFFVAERVRPASGIGLRIGLARRTMGASLPHLPVEVTCAPAQRFSECGFWFGGIAGVAAHSFCPIRRCARFPSRSLTLRQERGRVLGGDAQAVSDSARRGLLEQRHGRVESSATTRYGSGAANRPSCGYQRPTTCRDERLIGFWRSLMSTGR